MISLVSWFVKPSLIYVENMSPRTYRVDITDSPETLKDPTTPVDQEEGSMIINDLTPSKLEFKSDLDDDGIFQS